MKMTQFSVYSSRSLAPASAAPVVPGPDPGAMIYKHTYVALPVLCVLVRAMQASETPAAKKQKQK